MLPVRLPLLTFARPHRQPPRDGTDFPGRRYNAARQQMSDLQDCIAAEHFARTRAPAHPRSRAAAQPRSQETPPP
ncbi:hypothetical protein MDOR_36560 [Mycolicibacterium doricum]|uniref:Uncharacterized protein n=1 Tax=Mycolicibacterium doricum TaxID=126673 RepID=A0A7I7VXH4_9MYCO|nr:hypothetical protein MDOR_36560 [Mycolicibacterium doricum]